jgi:hypothetical protein
MLMVLVSPLTQSGTSFCRLIEAPRALVKRILIMVMESFIVAKCLVVFVQSEKRRFLLIGGYDWDQLKS